MVDDVVGQLCRKLDDLQDRLKGFDRLKRKGHSLDNDILKEINNMEESYSMVLEYFHKIKAYNYFREYKAWYVRYLNGGDAL